MKKTDTPVIFLLALLLTGCTGMNSDFQFDKPAKDSGVWMAEADDMSAGTSGNAPGTTTPAGTSAGTGINLGAWRLIDTGGIALEPQADVPAVAAYVSRSPSPGMVQRAGTSAMTGNSPSLSPVRPFTQSDGRLLPAGQATAYCSAPHCFPEPSGAFRRPDGVTRIWIAPYVSPDDSVHMGEVVYTVASPADWSGILL